MTKKQYEYATYATSCIIIIIDRRHGQIQVKVVCGTTETVETIGDA